jgi:hypothetical protein
VTEPRGGDREKLAVRADVDHRPGHRERDDLRIGHASPGVPRPLGQEIVGRGEHGRAAHVEVGEHRGPQGRRRVSGTDRLRLLLTTRLPPPSDRGINISVRALPVAPANVNGAG